MENLLLRLEIESILFCAFKINGNKMQNNIFENLIIILLTPFQIAYSIYFAKLQNHSKLNPNSIPNILPFIATPFILLSHKIRKKEGIPVKGAPLNRRRNSLFTPENRVL